MNRTAAKKPTFLCMLENRMEWGGWHRLIRDFIHLTEHRIGEVARLDAFEEMDKKGHKEVLNTWERRKKVLELLLEID